MPAPRHPGDDFETRTAFAAIRYRSGTLVIAPAGPVVGERESSILTREIDAALDRAGDGLGLLVLDLRDVEMLSSLGLGACIDARGRAKRLGARTALYGLRPHLDELFRMTRVRRLYKIVGTEAELAKLGAA